MINPGSLPPAALVHAMLATREQSSQHLEQGLGLLQQFDATLKALGNHWGSVANGTVEGHMRVLDQLLWQQLLVVCHEHGFVDDAMSGWTTLLQTNAPFNRDRVSATLAELDRRRPRMFLGGILDCTQLFDGQCLAQKGKVAGMVEFMPPWRHNEGWFRIDSGKAGVLDTLHRLMCLADEQALPAAVDLPTNWIARKDYAQAPWQAYFAVDRFKNGNGRITVHRLDLVDLLNACLERGLRKAA